MKNDKGRIRKKAPAKSQAEVSRRSAKKAAGARRRHVGEVRDKGSEPGEHITTRPGSWRDAFPRLLDLPVRRINGEELLPSVPRYAETMERMIGNAYDFARVFAIDNTQPLDAIIKQIQAKAKAVGLPYYDYYDTNDICDDEPQQLIVFYGPIKMGTYYSQIPIDFIEYINDKALFNACLHVFSLLMKRNGLGSLVQDMEDNCSNELCNGDLSDYCHAEDHEVQECELLFLQSQCQDFSWDANQSGKVNLLEKKIQSVRTGHNPIDRLWELLGKCGKLSEAEQRVWEWLSAYDADLMGINVNRYEAPGTYQKMYDQPMLTLEEQWRLTYSRHHVVCRIVENWHEQTTHSSGSIDPCRWKMVMDGKITEGPQDHNLAKLGAFLKLGGEIIKKHYDKQIREFYEQYGRP